MSDLFTPDQETETQQVENLLPNFLTISQLVTATKISRQTISRKIKTGEIPHVYVGSRVLIPTSYLIGLEQTAWSNVKKVG